MAPTRRGDPPEAKWHPARLIPSIGIKGSREQEGRATSSLLAVIPVSIRKSSPPLSRCEAIVAMPKPRVGACRNTCIPDLDLRTGPSEHYGRYRCHDAVPRSAERVYAKTDRHYHHIVV